MEIGLVLGWLAFCGLIAWLGKTGSEMLLLGMWGVLIIPALVELGRLIY